MVKGMEKYIEGTKNGSYQKKIPLTNPNQRVVMIWIILNYSNIVYLKLEQ
jgi:hypothetical protein